MKINVFKRPIEVEALQYDGTNLEEIQEFVGNRQIEGDHVTPRAHPIGTYVFPDEYRANSIELWVDSLATWLVIGVNDWVITDDGKSFYPRTDQIFQKNYGFKASDDIEEIDETTEDGRMLGRAYMALLQTRPASEAQAIAERLAHVLAQYRVHIEGNDNLVATEDTMRKVHEVLVDYFENVIDRADRDNDRASVELVSALQNAGIKFREVKGG